MKAHQADFEPVYAQGRVHAGFAERAANVNCDPLANLFERYENVVFAGHSLGGAVASLVLLRCLVSGVPRLDAADVAAKARCVTFGAPVGTNGPPTARSVFERVEVAEPWRDLFLHVVHGDDPVPRLLLRVDAAAPATTRDRAPSGGSDDGADAAAPPEKGRWATLSDAVARRRRSPRPRRRRVRRSSTASRGPRPRSRTARRRRRSRAASRGSRAPSRPAFRGE